MNTTVTIDKAGRMVIPKQIWDELRLEAGDTLTLESDAARVTLRPVDGATKLRKERGVWVFQGGGTRLSLDEALNWCALPAKSATGTTRAGAAGESLP